MGGVLPAMSLFFLAFCLTSGCSARYHRREYHQLSVRDIANDTCPAVATTTVELQPIVFSSFVPSNTAFDPFLLGTTYTITNAPTLVIIRDTITRTLVPATTTAVDAGPLPSTTGSSGSVGGPPPTQATRPITSLTTEEPTVSPSNSAPTIPAGHSVSSTVPIINTYIDPSATLKSSTHVNSDANSHSSPSITNPTLPFAGTSATTDEDGVSIVTGVTSEEDSGTSRTADSSAASTTRRDDTTLPQPSSTVSRTGSGSGGSVVTDTSSVSRPSVTSPSRSTSQPSANVSANLSILTSSRINTISSLGSTSSREATISPSLSDSVTQPVVASTASVVSLPSISPSMPIATTLAFTTPTRTPGSQVTSNPFVSISTRTTSSLQTSTSFGGSLKLGQGVREGVVTDIPEKESFIFLAYSTINMPGVSSTSTVTSSPERLRRAQINRRQSDTTASPVTIVALSGPTAAAVLPATNCDGSTPLRLTNGVLTLGNGTLGKLPGATDVLLGSLTNPPEDQVNRTFSLDNGILAWNTPSDGAARFFDCSGTITVVFTDVSPLGCVEVIVGAIAGQECSSMVEQTSTVDPVFTAPPLATDSVSISTASGTASTGDPSTFSMLERSSSSAFPSTEPVGDSTVLPSASTSEPTLSSSSSVSEPLLSSSIASAVDPVLFSISSTSSETSPFAAMPTPSFSTSGPVFSSSDTVSSDQTTSTWAASGSDPVSSTSAANSLMSITFVTSFSFSSFASAMSTDSTSASFRPESSPPGYDNSSETSSLSVSSTKSGSATTSLFPSSSGTVLGETSVTPSGTTSSNTVSPASSSVGMGSMRTDQTSLSRPTTSTESWTPSERAAYSSQSTLPTLTSGSTSSSTVTALLTSQGSLSIPSSADPTSTRSLTSISVTSNSNNAGPPSNSTSNSSEDFPTRSTTGESSGSSITSSTSPSTTTMITSLPSSSCLASLPAACQILPSVNGFLLSTYIEICKSDLRESGLIQVVYASAETCLDVASSQNTADAGTTLCLENAVVCGAVSTRLSSSFAKSTAALASTSSNAILTTLPTSSACVQLPPACEALAGVQGFSVLSLLSTCTTSLGGLAITTEVSSCLSLPVDANTQGASILACLRVALGCSPSVHSSTSITTTTVSHMFTPTSTTSSATSASSTPLSCLPGLGLYCSSLNSIGSYSAVLSAVGFCQLELRSAYGGPLPHSVGDCLDTTTLPYFDPLPGAGAFNCLKHEVLCHRLPSPISSSSLAVTTTPSAATTAATSTALPSCVSTLPGACTALSAVDGLALLTANPACAVALNAVVAISPQITACLDPAAISLFSLGADVVLCLEVTARCPEQSTTSSRTQTTPDYRNTASSTTTMTAFASTTTTPTPTVAVSFCLAASLPPQCLLLNGRTDLDVIPYITPCRSALSSLLSGPDLVVASSCLNTENTNLGSTMVACLNSKNTCLASSSATLSTWVAMTSSSATSSPTPTQSPLPLLPDCVLSLPPACLGLGAKSGSALENSAAACSYTISDGLSLAGIVKAGVCLNPTRIVAGLVSGQDVQDCLYDNVACSRPAVTSSTFSTTATSASSLATGTITDNGSVQSSSSATSTSTSAPRPTCLLSLPNSCLSLETATTGVNVGARANICSADLSPLLGGSGLLDRDICLAVLALSPSTTTGASVLACLNANILCTPPASPSTTVTATATITATASNTSPTPFSASVAGGSNSASSATSTAAAQPTCLTVLPGICAQLETTLTVPVTASSCLASLELSLSGPGLSSARACLSTAAIATSTNLELLACLTRDVLCVRPSGVSSSSSSSSSSSITRTSSTPTPTTTATGPGGVATSGTTTAQTTTTANAATTATSSRTTTSTSTSSTITTSPLPTLLPNCIANSTILSECPALPSTNGLALSTPLAACNAALGLKISVLGLARTAACLTTMGLTNGVAAVPGVSPAVPPTSGLERLACLYRTVGCGGAEALVPFLRRRG